MVSAKTFGITVTGTSAGEELLLCPFHPDKHPSAWWNPVKELFWCPVCQKGMNTKQMMAALGLEGIETDCAPEQIPDYNLFGEASLLPEGSVEWIDYYYERDITLITMFNYDLQVKKFSPEGVILPIYNSIKKKIGVCIRYFNPKETGTRYTFLGKTTPLWPMQKLPKRKGEWIVVTEGSWSAMRMASYDIFHSYFALLGAKANAGILEAVRPYKPIILYDGDKAGVNACKKMRGLGVEHAYCLKTSPDDMDEEEIQKLIGKVEKICRS